jgi:DNA polymerase-3 subunit beta
MIHQVVFAASTDEARPVLTGVQLLVEGSKITLSAADGFRLSVRSASLSSAVSRPVNAIIPARALSELARITADSDQPLTMVIPPGRGQVIFRMKDIELVSQLIEGLSRRPGDPARLQDPCRLDHLHISESLQTG